MKYKIISLIRALGLLRLADSLKFWLKGFALKAKNRHFIATHPNFPVPPTRLAFDAYNTYDWHEYHQIGKKHATLLADIIQTHAKQEKAPFRILEWGCGPGRLIRHMPDLLQNRSPIIVGSDYNPETIEWCQSNLPKIQFIDNQLLPPLKQQDHYFSASYNFSVFTHLSEQAQLAWAKELWRLLKPGGLLVCTTHGDYYQYLLTKESEQKQYESGRVVTQGHYSEGKKWFFAIHPPQYVKQVLLKDFIEVECLNSNHDIQLYQDIWIARKP